MEFNECPSLGVLGLTPRGCFGANLSRSQNNNFIQSEPARLLAQYLFTLQRTQEVLFVRRGKLYL